MSWKNKSLFGPRAFDGDSPFTEEEKDLLKAFRRIGILTRQKLDEAINKLKGHAASTSDKVIRAAIQSRLSQVIAIGERLHRADAELGNLADYDVNEAFSVEDLELLVSLVLEGFEGPRLDEIRRKKQIADTGAALS